MATNTAESSITATLSTTTVDTCTLSGSLRGIRVWNLTGSTSLYVTVGTTAAQAATPSAGGDGTMIVPAGIWRVIPGDWPSGATVKIIGSGNAYVVEAA